MSRTITFIRHGETTANVETRWQGQLDAELSPTGLDQVARLGKRVAGTEVSRLISSDLGRTMNTAAAVGEATADPRWREFDVGRWEGLTSEEVQEQFPGELEGLISGEDVSLGGGERMSVFRERITDAFWDLADSMEDGDEATVVTHGGVIWGIASDVLGFSGNAPMIPAHNTSFTHITIDSSNERQLTVFNDSTHLDSVPTQFGPEGKLVTVIRHGQTEGNVVHRWQGRTDSPLTETGQAQVASTAHHLPPLDALYTSPLGRTMHTSRILTERLDLDPVPHDGLVEMAFGAWEDLTFEESEAQDPELFQKVYRQEIDLPRGRTGESFAQAGERFADTIALLVAASNGDRLGAVSHGAAIRAYLTGIAGLGFAERNTFALPRNSSMSSVIYSDQAPVLASFNVAPHLD